MGDWRSHASNVNTHFQISRQKSHVSETTLWASQPDRVERRLFSKEASQTQAAQLLIIDAKRSGFIT